MVQLSIVNYFLVHFLGSISAPSDPGEIYPHEGLEFRIGTRRGWTWGKGATEILSKGNNINNK